MRFTQIKHANGTTALKWQGHHNSDALETSLTSEDRPHDGFTRALEALRPQVPKLIGAAKDYAEGVEVRSLAISYQKGDRRGFVITAVKPVEVANGPFNISTPLLLEPDLDSDGGGQASQDLMELFEELIEQARLFVSGRREQGELFSEGEDPAAAARLQEERQEDEAERASEVDRVIAYLVGQRPDEFEEWDDERILRDVLDCFSERLEGKDYAQFSHLKASGTSRARCALSTEGAVPRLWYGVNGRIDPEKTPATLMGTDLVAVVRRVWSAQQDPTPLLHADEESPALAWARACHPKAQPTSDGTITTEIVAQCLHSLLIVDHDKYLDGAELRDCYLTDMAAAFHVVRETGIEDDELLVLVKARIWEANPNAGDRFSHIELVGEGREDEQQVTVDVRLKPALKITVGKGKTKRKVLDADQVLQVVRGMLDIGTPEPAELEEASVPV